MKKLKKEDNDSINTSFIKITKNKLSNVIRDETLLPIIQDLVIRTNKIVIHAYQFLKLYCLHCFEIKEPLPKITKQLLCDIFKVVSIQKTRKRKLQKETTPEQLKILTQFYKEVYVKTICENENLYYDKLPFILGYEAVDMLTNIHTNIQEHFLTHLSKYVHTVFNVKAKRMEITKNTPDKAIRKELHTSLFKEINQVKKDLVSFENCISDVTYHAWIKEQRTKLFPGKTSFEKNSIHCELQSNPQSFLHALFFMARELEALNKSKIENQENPIRLFNVLPLRTSLIPKHICLDTCGLLRNLMGERFDNSLFRTYKKENQYHQIWNTVFHLDRKSFSKGKKYAFHHMIKTDGVSISILFHKVDENGNPISKKMLSVTNLVEENIEYIEKTKKIKELQQMKVVCADPGLSDLLYFGSYDDANKLETFRYTQNQRRLETRTKKYNKIIDKMNKETLIEGKTITEIETGLSKLNSKSCDYDTFEMYCIQKNKLNNQLYIHYEQFFFRKCKMNVFTNTQKSESKMIKNFSKKFGTPDKTILVVGDYDKGNNHMKGKEPAICKKFRRIFRNAGYQTFLINEFRTSKLCNSCNEEIEKFLEKPSKKPKRKGEKEICHGLLRCQSVKHTSEIIHNRDKNAVQNMLAIVKSVFQTGKRPNEFCRTALELENSYPFHDGL